MAHKRIPVKVREIEIGYAVVEDNKITVSVSLDSRLGDTLIEALDGNNVMINLSLGSYATA